MVDPRHADPRQDLSDALAESSSRRFMLKRLAALGLVAAGGLALAPRVAEAKPKQGDKQGGKGNGKGKGKGNGDGDGDGNGQDRNRREDGPSALAVVSNPTIRSPLLYIGPSDAGIRRVTVTGTIVFTKEHVALMRLGRQFRVTCKVMEADDNPDDFCFSYSTRYTYPLNRTTPTTDGGATGALSFVKSVASSVLDDDDYHWYEPGSDEEDDPYGLLTIATSTTNWRSSSTLTSVKTPQRPGYY